MDFKTRFTCGLPDWLRVFPSGFDCGQSEVADFDSKVVVVEKYVVALQVSVNDVFRVEIAEITT